VPKRHLWTRPALNMALHLWTRPALNMALNLRPRHRRPRIDRRAAPLVKWAMHSARPNFTSAAHREERLNEERLGRAAMDGAGGGERGALQSRRRVGRREGRARAGASSAGVP
jgi:hypothetical protein